eukprot:PhF_6_TR19941/c0_g1_i2/m.29018
MGGGGIDGAVHDAAGPLLRLECRKLNGCETGQTKITKGHRLPAKHILHTVGPVGGGEAELQSCYSTCLQLVYDNQLRSVAFCCISTGVFGFPLVAATHIALRTVREWLEVNGDRVDKIVFCTFMEHELGVYERLMPTYFPTAVLPIGAPTSTTSPPVPPPPPSTLEAADPEAENK